MLKKCSAVHADRAPGTGGMAGTGVRRGGQGIVTAAVCLLTACLSLILFRQSAFAGEEAQLASHYIVNNMGVDLEYGAYTYTNADISIGTGSFPEKLTLLRSYNSGFKDQNASDNAGFKTQAVGIARATTHNFFIRLEYVGNTSNGEIILRVRRGFSVEEFVETEELKYANRRRSGSTLFFYYVLNRPEFDQFHYILKDGSVIKFDLSDGTKRCADGGVFNLPRRPYCLVPTSWEFPNGEKIVFSYDPLETATTVYDFQRLAQVQNTRGDTLRFYYDTHPDGYELMTVEKVVAFNALETCTFGSNAVATGRLCDPPSTGARSVHYESPFGNVTSFTDETGNETVYGFDSNDRLTAVKLPTDPLNNAISIDYSNEAYTINYNRVISQQLNGAGSWTYSYERIQDIIEDTIDVKTTIVDSLGNQTVAYFRPWRTGYPAKSFLGLSGPMWVEDSFGRRTNYEYDFYGRLIKTTFPEGNSVSLTLNSEGNVTQKTLRAKPGSTEPDIVTNAEFPNCYLNYTICNKPSWVEDANGKRTDFTYDSGHGGVLKVLGPADSRGIRPKTKYSYTSKSVRGEDYYGDLEDVGDPITVLAKKSQCILNANCTGTADEIVTSYDYGPDNVVNRRALTSVTVDSGGLGLTTAFTYDSDGNQITQDGPRTDVSDLTRYQYDDAGRPTFTVLPDPDGSGPALSPAARHHYDADGRLWKIESGTAQADGSNFTVLQATCTLFTTSGQKQMQWGPGVPSESGATEGCPDRDGAGVPRTEWTYDLANRVDQIIDRLGPGEGADRITKILYCDHTVTGSGEACSDGKIWKEIRAYGSPNEQVYRRHGYSENGEVVWVEDANGNRTSYTYDGHDRRKKNTFPDSTYEKLTYDKAGNVLTKQTRAGDTIGYTYDNLGRITAKSVPGIPDVSYEYDLLGRQIKVSDAGGPGDPAADFQYAYDNVGRVLSVDDRTAARIVSFDYDEAGNRTRMTWPDGYFVTYDYDANNALTEVREQGASLLARYTYDPRRRLSGINQGNGTSTTIGYEPDNDISSLSHNYMTGPAPDYTYSYNRLNQLTGEEMNDPALLLRQVSRTSTYTVNNLNQYTGMTADGSSVTFDHDANGNFKNDGSNVFDYDAENRLIGATMAGGADVAYSYDPFGRRESKSVDGVETDYLYDEDHVIAEYDGNGAILRRYVPGPGIDRPIALVEGDAVSGYSHSYYHTNRQGSVTALTDDSGTEVTRYTYDAYGVPYLVDPVTGTQTRVAAGQPYLFNGRRFDFETGFYYLRARYYSATLGRFLQTDPVGYGDQMNLYAYVGNDPVNAWDPTGLKCYTLRRARRNQGSRACDTERETVNEIQKDLRKRDSGVREYSGYIIKDRLGVWDDDQKKSSSRRLLHYYTIYRSSSQVEASLPLPIPRKAVSAWHSHPWKLKGKWVEDSSGRGGWAGDPSQFSWEAVTKDGKTYYRSDRGDIRWVWKHNFPLWLINSSSQGVKKKALPSQVRFTPLVIKNGKEYRRVLEYPVPVP